MKLRSRQMFNRAGLMLLVALCMGTAVLSQAQTAVLGKTSLNFGPVLIGQTPSYTLPLKNTGTAALNISSIATNGPVFTQTNNCGASLAAGATCSITLTFAPAANGVVSDVLSVTDNASGSPHTTTLGGTGMAPAYLSASNFTFGTQVLGNSSAAQTVIVTNRQATPLAMSAGASGDFVIQTDRCGGSIPASGSCTLGVVFSPTASGPRTGVLTVTPAVGPALTANLTGTGIVQFTVSPTVLGFGTQATGTTGTAQVVTLNNTQGTSLPVSNVSASAGYVQSNTCGSSLAANSSCTFSVAFAPTALGSVSGTLSFTVGSGTAQSIALSGTGIAPFAISSTSVAFGNVALGTTTTPQLVTLKNQQNLALGISSIAITSGFSQTNNCGSSIAASASCSFYVTFTPAASGSATGSLSFALSNGASPQTVSLSGSGVVPFTLSPATLLFGNVATGNTSTVQTLTLTNKQNVPLGISSLGISSGFAQTNTCGSSLAVGASCAFSVTFSPSAAGATTGTLSFGLSNGGAQTVTLSGTGILPLTITPTTLSFGPQSAGISTAAATISLKNNQNVPLGISSISVTGPFSQTNTCGTSVAPGASCKISVTFTPLTMGVLSGSLTLSDDSTTMPSNVISLSGTGVAPMSLSASAVAFGTQALGGTTAAKTITVKNSAKVDFTIASIATTGDFPQTNDCPSTLTAGSSCTVSIVFAPSAMGTRSGTLTVTDSAINSPLVANLGGVGAAGLTSITVTPASISLGIGAQQQYVATGKYSDNSTKDVTSLVTWTSGNAAVGINASGLAQVFATPDIAIPITATSGGIVSAPAWLSALSTLPRVCSTPTIDMKLLVITNGQTEADFSAIKQVLDYLGTPYTVFDMTVETGGITSTFLSDGGCHGYYQGVIFTYGSYIYTLPGMSTLTSYEQTFKVRQLNWFTYPGTDFGMNTATQTISSNSTYSANFTAAGAQVFPYANTATPLAISNAAVYLATAVTGSASGTTTTGGGTNISGTPVGPTATPLLTDSTGHALSVVYDFGDGRQYLSQTFDSNQYLTHNLVLAYGLINWVTKGIFLGEYHVYASASVDDFFINDSEWVPGTPCTDPITHDRTASDDPSLPTFRLNAADMTALVNWQNKTNQDPLLASFKLSLAFNGVGTAGNTDWTGLTARGVANDDLLTSFPNYQQYFHWMSHTYDHPETLDGLTKSGPADPNGDTIDLEILTNLWVAGAAGGVNLDTDSSDSGLRQLSFTDFDPHAMVTPGVTGLDDPNVSPYLFQDGIFYVVSDTSVTPTATNNNGPNPSPNVGIVNSYAPGIYEVPRHANDVYFNAANWNDDAAEFHCIYGPEGSNQTPYSNFTSAQILDFVSTSFVNNMLLGDMDPQMFHQPNLHAYDGTHSMIGDTYDMTFSKYEALYKLPVLSPTQAQTAQLMQARNNYNLAGATGTLVGGSSPTITINIPAGGPVTSAVIPVTGLNSTGAELYGPSYISHINATAGTAITLPVQ